MKVLSFLGGLVPEPFCEQRGAQTCGQWVWAANMVLGHAGSPKSKYPEAILWLNGKFRLFSVGLKVWNVNTNAVKIAVKCHLIQSRFLQAILWKHHPHCLAVLENRRNSPHFVAQRRRFALKGDKLKHRRHFTSLFQKVSHNSWKLFRAAGSWDVWQAIGHWTRWGWPKMTRARCRRFIAAECGHVSVVQEGLCLLAWLEKWEPVSSLCHITDGMWWSPGELLQQQRDFSFIQSTTSWRKRSLGTISCSGVQGRLEEPSYGCCETQDQNISIGDC